MRVTCDAEHKLIADEFLEELIVRRELAFNFARFTRRSRIAGRAAGLGAQDPAEARAATGAIPRSRASNSNGRQTYDALWNATQKEMLLRGKIHGYYRMYWGKKIIEWSPRTQEALATMIHLHDRYALDGRDPNTYTNILWCFGLHDRPWLSVRSSAQMRYMTLDGMKRKTNMRHMCGR